MNEVRTRIRVGSDHRISGVAPPDVPPGEHEVTFTLVPSPARETPAKSSGSKTSRNTILVRGPRGSACVARTSTMKRVGDLRRHECAGLCGGRWGAAA